MLQLRENSNHKSALDQSKYVLTLFILMSEKFEGHESSEGISTGTN